MRRDLKEGERLLVIRRKDEIILKKPKKISETALLSEKSLAKQWLSPEDEEAFAYLQ